MDVKAFIFNLERGDKAEGGQTFTCMFFPSHIVSQPLLLSVFLIDAFETV